MALEDYVDIFNTHDDWSKASSRAAYGEKHVVVTPNGFFVLGREDYFSYLRPMQWTDIPRLLGGLAQKEGNLALFTKLPWSLLCQAIGFFKKVWEKSRCEAILLLYYYPKEKRYELIPPPIKEATARNVDYEVPVTPPNALRFGSLHSHGPEMAYHSSTDWGDDKDSPGIHLVIGNLNQPFPTILCVYSTGKNIIPVSLVEVVDVGQPWPEPPPQWLNHIGGKRKEPKR